MRNRLLMPLAVLAACAQEEPYGPIPGVYPIVPAPDLDDLGCEAMNKGAFTFDDDAQVVARGDRDTRRIDTWKMTSQGETYRWDLDSPDCEVTIPAADATPNLPSWRCALGDAQYFYEQGQYKMTVDAAQRVDGAWVDEDHLELWSVEIILGCVDGDCFNFDGWAEAIGTTMPCENRFGYQATWAPG
jgi:hypothetical protein